jgi:hypothetical protein
MVDPKPSKEPKVSFKLNKQFKVDKKPIKEHKVYRQPNKKLMVVEPVVGFHIHFATEKMLISRQEMQA